VSVRHNPQLGHERSRTHDGFGSWLRSLYTALSFRQGQQEQCVTHSFCLALTQLNSLVPRHQSDVGAVPVLLHHRGYVSVFEEYSVTLACIPVSKFLTVVLTRIIQSLVCSCKRLPSPVIVGWIVLLARERAVSSPSNRANVRFQNRGRTWWDQGQSTTSISSTAGLSGHLTAMSTVQLHIFCFLKTTSMMSASFGSGRWESEWKSPIVRSSQSRCRPDLCDYPPQSQTDHI